MLRALQRRGHSLSSAMLLVGAAFVVASFLVEHHTWRYDFLMSVGCDLIGAAAFVFGARYLWEQGSDPATPPTEK